MSLPDSGGGGTVERETGSIFERRPLYRTPEEKLGYFRHKREENPTDPYYKVMVEQLEKDIQETSDAQMRNDRL